MKKVQDIDLKGKKVICRVGLDVNIENGRAGEKFKIQTVKEVVDYLTQQGAKIALMTWLGRPDGKKDLNFSLSQIRQDVEEILGYKTIFVPDCIGPGVFLAMENLKEGEIVLLENVRFHSGEGSVKTGEDYDEEFAKKLAENFDVFVNDAFSQSHRSQASICGIPKFIPGVVGILLQKEISEMEKIKNSFSRPAVAIIGGAKIETKLPVINFFEQIYDVVLVGGKIANEAIDQKIEFSEKVILPIDFVDDRLDIGPKTLEKFKEKIADAKTIVWNGPLGKFEEEKYSRGTYEVLDAILENKDVHTVLGGGETLEALEKKDVISKISFVSTGGGAMLEYLEGKKMPGLEVLE